MICGASPRLLGRRHEPATLIAQIRSIPRRRGVDAGGCYLQPGLNRSIPAGAGDDRGAPPLRAQASDCLTTRFSLCSTSYLRCPVAAECVVIAACTLPRCPPSVGPLAARPRRALQVDELVIQFHCATGGIVDPGLTTDRSAAVSRAHRSPSRPAPAHPPRTPPFAASLRTHARTARSRWAA